MKLQTMFTENNQVQRSNTDMKMDIPGNYKLRLQKTIRHKGGTLI